LLRWTRPDAFSTTIAYPLPETSFYEEVQGRLTSQAKGEADWKHTAENRVLFERNRFSTLFYRRVIRWFHSEWRDARLAAGAQASFRERLRGKIGLWRDRFLVHVITRLPAVFEVHFRPRLEG
jgi:hypothetical protein